MKAINFLAGLCFVLSACGPSSEQLTATAIVAQAQTQTAAPTITPTTTPTATPTATQTPTLTPTPAPTQTPSAQCKIVSASPVTGSAVPAYKILVEGFAPKELVLIALRNAGSEEIGTLLFTMANDQGQISGTIAWGKTGAAASANLQIELKGAGCTASQILTWP